jgi:hypothetical protein
MRKIKILFACLALAFTGCKASLQTGGAYAPVDAAGAATVQPDMSFYVADAAYNLAYSVVDAAFKFEYDNRALLWKASPQIKHTLDGVRPQAVAANLEWAKARQVYMLNPVPANLSALQAILAKVQQLAQTATSVLPK